MKQILFFSILLLFSSISYAQAPQGISYQAIAFNSDGSPVADGTVGVQVSILDNSVTGTAVYIETHSKTTNAQGLFNLNIGEGTATSGSFSNIDWATNSKFLKVEIDPNGGTNYTTVGSSELMSVPYALFAENVNTDNLPPATAAPQTASSPTGTMLVVYTSTNAYGFAHSSSGNPSWYSTSLSGTVLGAVATDESIVVYTTSNAYGFRNSASGNPSWYSNSLSGTPTGATSSGNTIVVYTSSNAYGFALSSSGNPSWYSNSLSGTPMGTTVNGNDVVVVYTSSNAYGFTTSSSGNPSWYSNSLSGTPLGASSTGNLIVVYTTTNAYGFSISSSGNPSWYSNSLSGTPEGIAP